MTTLKFDRQIGAELCEWHSGMGCPLYEAGSHIYAGHQITREQAQAALVELQYCLDGMETNAEWKKHPEYDTDLAQLKRLIKCFEDTLDVHATEVALTEEVR